MANTDLRNSTQYTVPDTILQDIKVASQRFPGNQRAHNLVTSPKLSYENAKRIKNALESYDVNSPEYALAGGKGMLNWLNKTLTADRAAVVSTKTTKSNAGFANQFRREHQRTGLKPSHNSGSGLKPEKTKRSPLFEGQEGQKATAAIGIIVNPEQKFLLVKRAADDDWMPGKWALPGGGIEAGEHAALTIVREIREEVNLDIEAVKPLVDIKESNGTWCTYLIAVSKTPEQLQLNHEHSEAKWIGLAELESFDGVPDLVQCVNEALKAYKRN